MTTFLVAPAHYQCALVAHTTNSGLEPAAAPPPSMPPRQIADTHVHTHTTTHTHNTNTHAHTNTYTHSNILAYSALSPP